MEVIVTGNPLKIEMTGQNRLGLRTGISVPGARDVWDVLDGFRLTDTRRKAD